MPKDSRSRTRATRARMAATGETYTQALAGLERPPGMDRDTPPNAMTIALMFGELMAAGRRAAWSASEPARAAEAVRAAVTPLWPRVAPEAARDVLVASAELAVDRQITAVPDTLQVGPPAGFIVGGMLELTAERAAGPKAAADGRRGPAETYASSCAFDRDDDAVVLEAVCALLVLAHPAPDPSAEQSEEGEDWPAECPECGGDDPQGTYGCECFNPSACPECGDPDGHCDCWG